MFLYLLDPDQRQRFFEAAHYVAAIDGVTSGRRRSSRRLALRRVWTPCRPPRRVRRRCSAPALPCIAGRSQRLPPRLTGFVAAGGDPARELAFFHDCGEALGAFRPPLAAFKDFARHSFEVYRAGLDLIAEGSGSDEGA